MAGVAAFAHSLFARIVFPPTPAAAPDNYSLGSSSNTLRGDTWLQQNVPLITNSAEYKAGGALFIIWDEAEDNGAYSDGPIGMFLLSPFAKGSDKSAYSNSIYYTHSSTLKTVEEIFGVTPLLGAAGDASTTDLSDFFKKQ